MTQSLLGAFTKKLIDDPYCKGEDEPVNQKWDSRVNDWGTHQNCTGKRLYTEMNKKKKQTDYEFQPPPIPYIPKPKDKKDDVLKAAQKSSGWSLKTCSKKYFPLQAHHLIPKNYLPDHKVCVFLSKGFTKSKKFQLTGDSPYDTDNRNNGYCMPYATPLAEWKKAKESNEDKLAITALLMNKTERQIHQGSHRVGSYVDPYEATEEDLIHDDVEGYLDTVESFLDVIYVGMKNHLLTCPICKPNKDKQDIRPLKVVVDHMNNVSGIIKQLIDANRIFVSEAAFLHLGKKEEIKIPQWLIDSD